MANPAKKYINEEIDRLRSLDNQNHALSSMARNLNLLALRDDLAPVFHRESEVDAIQKLLLRRTKPNALLTGPAGCGKTAIAEALAIHIAYQRANWLAEDAKADREYNRAYEKWYANEDRIDSETGEVVIPMPERREVPKPPLCDVVIYDLSMNALVSGTKYRGEFEEKMQNIMDCCKRNKDIVLFIDEIHQIGEIGSSEGATNMGQILKPALARAEIRVIGATTTEESAILKKDKALARRFSDVEVRPLVGDKALSTADSILRDYEKFHAVTVKDTTAEQILELVNFHVGGVFPNSFIDVIDEAMSGARFEGKNMIRLPEIKATLSRMTGNIIL
jgi:ATP-dependent Clp protease ATP-binding subunit ClpA